MAHAQGRRKSSEVETVAEGNLGILLPAPPIALYLKKKGNVSVPKKSCDARALLNLKTMTDFLEGFQ